MNDNSFCIRRWHLAVSVLLLLAVQTVFAGNAPHVSPSSSASSVSGSYKVTQNTPLGSQTRLQMRIHLANHGSSDLSIDHITLWSLSHPDRGASRTSSLIIRAHGSIDTTQEFTIRRLDVQLWRRGLRPRLLLQTTGPSTSKSQTLVRLALISPQEVK
jgi:hypothetical protein